MANIIDVLAEEGQRCTDAFVPFRRATSVLERERAHTVTINAGSSQVVSVSGSQFNCGFLWDGADWHVITFSTTGATTVTLVSGS